MAKGEYMKKEDKKSPFDKAKKAAKKAKKKIKDALKKS